MNPDTNEAAAAVARALVLHALDNVATALHALPGGEAVRQHGAGSDATVALCEPIALCHKFALRPIAAGEQVIKSTANR